MPDFLSVGPLTDTLGSLSSIMFSSVCACLLRQAAGVLSAPHPQRPTQHSAVISLLVYLGAWRVFPQSQIKKVCQKKRAYLQFRTHFSIRQEIYCRLSIVRCWQIPHIFHIRPPETWGRFKTQGTSSTKTLFDLRSTGRNEPNIHSVFLRKYFLWYKCNITGHKSFRNSFGNHLKNTFICGVFINKRDSRGKFYLYIHAFNRFSYSCIHSFTRPSQWLCVRPLCVCAYVCVWPAA